MYQPFPQYSRGWISWKDHHIQSMSSRHLSVGRLEKFLNLSSEKLRASHSVTNWQGSEKEGEYPLENALWTLKIYRTLRCFGSWTLWPRSTDLCQVPVFLLAVPGTDGKLESPDFWSGNEAYLCFQIPPWKEKCGADQALWKAQLLFVCS